MDGYDATKANLPVSFSAPLKKDIAVPSIRKDRVGEQVESSKYSLNPDWGGVLPSNELMGAAAAGRGFFVNGIKGAVASLGNIGNAEAIGTALRQAIQDNDMFGAISTLGSSYVGTKVGNIIQKESSILRMKNESINAVGVSGVSDLASRITSFCADNLKKLIKE